MTNSLCQTAASCEVSWVEFTAIRKCYDEVFGSYLRKLIRQVTLVSRHHWIKNKHTINVTECFQNGFRISSLLLNTFLNLNITSIILIWISNYCAAGPNKVATERLLSLYHLRHCPPVSRVTSSIPCNHIHWSVPFERASFCSVFLLFSPTVSLTFILFFF